MTELKKPRIKVKVSPPVARIVGPGASRELQLSAIRGDVPLTEKDLLTVVLFLCTSRDPEVRDRSKARLSSLRRSLLIQSLEEPDLPPQLIDLLAKLFLDDQPLMTHLIDHPSISDQTVHYLAENAKGPLLAHLADHRSLQERFPWLPGAVLANPNADNNTREQLLGAKQGQEESPSNESPPEDIASDNAMNASELSRLLAQSEETGASKFQIAMDLEVAQKIKLAMTGDKEWRTIFVKDTNKVVQAAVLKNPRITDGEIVMIAKNRTSSDELIRLIMLNRDWMKLYEVKKALATHPKTPLPKAIRLIAHLDKKDLRELIRSKSVSTLISTSARKEYERRLKRGG